jgi:hypothetical protein
VYPYLYKYAQNLSQSTMRANMTALASEFRKVHAERLVINLMAHSGGGIVLANMVYSEEQVLDSILRPLIKGFRLHGNRTLASPVAVLLNSCDANHEAWHHLLQAEPAVTRFDMVVCRKPVLLEEIPRVLSNFTRAYTNKVFTRQPNVTAADALAEAVTPMFARETEPVVLQYGKAPVDVWAVSKPSSSAAALALVPGLSDTSAAAAGAPGSHSLSLFGFDATPLPPPPFATAASTGASAAAASSGLSSFPALPFLDPVAAAEFATESIKPPWPTGERDSTIVSFVSQLTNAERTSGKLTGVTSEELLDALNLLVTILRPKATTTLAVPFYSDSARYRTFRAVHWTYDRSRRQYNWPNLAAAAGAATSSGP